MRKFVRLQYLTVEHRDDARFPAGQKHLLQGRNGRAFRRIGRLEDIIAAQIIKEESVYTCRILDL